MRADLDDLTGDDHPGLLAHLEARARRRGHHNLQLSCPEARRGLIATALAWGYYPRPDPGAGTVVLQKNLTAADELAARLPGWRPELTGTLTFVVTDGQVLLIRKKTGHGAGKINAPGGKLEADETPAQCAVRETREEVGIRVADPRLMAELKFIDTEGPQWYGYVYTARAFRGEPHETDEAAPGWYPLDALPFHEMWQDDRVWLPLVLEGRRLAGEFLFAAGDLKAHRLQALPG